jgi:transposase
MTMTEVIMRKKRYPDEFKVGAVKQVVDCGHSVADVAGYLGMTTHSLYAWIKKFGPDFAKHNAMSDDQAEIRRLKKELKRTTEERDLLKKAAVYFANQPE